MRSKINLEKGIEKIIPIDGQITIWDLLLIEKNKTKVIKMDNKNIDADNQMNRIDINRVNEKQKEMIEQYKNNIDLNRIIIYGCGWLGIELEYKNSFKTIYVNKKGQKEFNIDKKSCVLPMDRILYYRTSNIPVNNIQKEVLKNILERSEVKEVIRRKGDENILVELSDEIVSINFIGWQIPFKNVKKLEYTADEIYKVNA